MTRNINEAIVPTFNPVRELKGMGLPSPTDPATMGQRGEAVLRIATSEPSAA